MTERNTNNLDAHDAEPVSNTGAEQGATDAGASVQAQLEANGRARQILETQQKETEAEVAQAEKEHLEAAKNARAQEEAEKAEQAEAEAVAKAEAEQKEKERAEKAENRKKAKADKVPAMAPVNLMTKRNGLAQNKKIWLGVGGVAIAVLILVIVGVVIGVNGGEGDCRDDVVVLDYTPDGYDGEVTDSTAAAVFSENVMDKMNSDENYTYENAISDYENAYVSTEGEMRLDVLLSYAYFVFTETGNVENAIKILERIYDNLTDEGDIAKYYTAIINMYEQSGQAGQADYYRSMLNDLVKSPLIPQDAV